MNHLNLSPKALLAGVGLAAAVCTAAFGQTPPVNNECSGALPIVPGVPAAFDTTDATGSPEAVGDEAACGGDTFAWGDPLQNPDVWFRWTPTENALVTATTCDPASYDTSLIMYSGSCGALTRVACNGDAPGSATAGTCQQWFSRIENILVTAGTTYYFRVGGWQGDPEDIQRGPGLLTITTAPPFVYQCTAPVQPNDCATGATVVNANESFVVDTTGFNTDGPALTGGTCGTDIFHDVWFQVPVTQGGTLVVSTCNSTFLDTRIALYDMGTSPGTFNFNDLQSVQVACADAGCGTDQLQARLASVVIPGRTYLVRVGGGADIEQGSFSVTVTLPQECSLQAASILEEEPCGEDLNGGCNEDPEFPPVQQIPSSGRLGGTFWATAGTRDTDWFQFTLATDQRMAFTLTSTRSNAGMFLFRDVCPTGTQIASTFIAAETCSSTMGACLRAGTYRLVVVPPFVDNPCGSGALNQYRVDISSQPDVCDQVLLAATCTNPGPVTSIGSASLELSGYFSTGPAGTPACNLNGSTANCPSATNPLGSGRTFWATPYQGAQIPKQVNCITMALAPYWRTAAATGTCGLFLSNRSLPLTVSIYRDINGGDPTNFVGQQAGGDLELIRAFRVLTPVNSSGLLTLTLPDPLCLENETNVVLVLECPNLLSGTAQELGDVPAGQGYLAGILLTRRPEVGSVSTTFRKSCNEAGFTRGFATSCNLAGEPAGTCIEWGNALVGDVQCVTTPCPADFNDDDFVNGDDLGVLLGAWGQCANAECPTDLNDDGFVNGDDLGVLLGAWGACPS